jgi:hypothetical protein
MTSMGCELSPSIPSSFMPHITSLGKVEIQNMVSDDRLPYLHHHSQKNPKLEHKVRDYL